MSAPTLVAAGDGRSLWRAAELAAWEGSLEGEPIGMGAGRGVVERARLGPFDAIVRRYHRGGALRRILPDVFVGAGRAMAEVEALARLAPLGLAPRPLVLEARGGIFKRLRIAVEEIKLARNLLELARDEPTALDARLGRLVGRAVRAMHDAGVAHPDLNVGNILIVSGPHPRAWLIDFDGARVGDAPVAISERAREIARLARSLDKWAPTAITSASARAAFVRAALPAGQRLAAWRGARR